MSKPDNQAFVPALGRGLSRCRFAPFRLRFQSLSHAFQDGKAQGGIRRWGSEGSSRASRRAVFCPRGRSGAVPGPAKPKSSPTGFSAVSVWRFPRWLMGSKESRHLKKNGSIQGRCRHVPSCAASTTTRNKENCAVFHRRSHRAYRRSSRATRALRSRTPSDRASTRCRCSRTSRPQ